MKIAPTEEILKMTAVLYSVSQDCFHLETVREYLNDNILKSAQDVRSSDYFIIGIAENDTKGDEYIKMFKGLKNKFDLLNHKK